MPSFSVHLGLETWGEGATGAQRGDRGGPSVGPRPPARRGCRGAWPVPTGEREGNDAAQGGPAAGGGRFAHGPHAGSTDELRPSVSINAETACKRARIVRSL